MRALFQAGLRPAVARLYDPFDAMLAKQGGVKGKRAAGGGASARAGDGAGGETRKKSAARSFGGAALRAVLRRPGAINELLHTRAATKALGGAMLVVVFEGTEDEARQGVDHARRLFESMGGVWEGEGPARRWLAHRYSVSYRQAPVFANGAFVDTMEVAARWSHLGALYEGVRRALGEHVFVMAHLSHAYPDGCCIYFSFVGSADPGLARSLGWEAACEATYDRAWRAALAAAVEAGGTLAHHHGVGRSKAPRLPSELGTGIDVVRALMRAFDPAGILNPGNLVGPGSASPSPSPSSPVTSTPGLDRESLLACIAGETDLGTAEKQAERRGPDARREASLPHRPPSPTGWRSARPGAARPLARSCRSAPRGPRRVAARTIASSSSAPRRAGQWGPDLTALFVGARRPLRPHRPRVDARASARRAEARDTPSSTTASRPCRRARQPSSTPSRATSADPST